MTVLGSDDELSVSMRSVPQWDDDLCASRPDLVVERIDLFDHDVQKPGVVPSRLGIHLVGALAEHDPDRVSREEAPSGRLDRIPLEPQDVDVVTSGVTEVAHCRDRARLNPSSHLSLPARWSMVGLTVSR
jgi:hypothetical protein